MKKLTTYTYTVLRYIHDITTGEFVNIGVVLYAPDDHFLAAKCRPTSGRISKLFPGIKTTHLKNQMREIQRLFDEKSSQLKGTLKFNTNNTVIDLAHKVLKPDDSSLQWSQMGVGRTNNPANELDSLYLKMVTKYDESPSQHHRTEDDIWRKFKKDLISKNLLSYFEPKTIIVDNDEIEFKHTWKNGTLHCLEAISFDLSSADRIRDKAYRWLGRATSVSETPESLRLYFLVGKPQNQDLEVAFENALSILKKIKIETQVVQEDNSQLLSEMLEEAVSTHEEQTHCN